MFAKRSRGYAEEDVSPQKRLRENIIDLFLGNDISGPRANAIFRDADAAGAAGFRDLKKTGAGGRQPGNSSRDILRKLRKMMGWPRPYTVEVPMWDARSQTEVMAPIQLLLPHELIHSLGSKAASLAALCREEGLCASSRDYVAELKRKLACENLVPLSLWLDGVPCNWDRSQSLECIAMSLPGQVGKFGNLRLPLCVINKRFCIKRTTIDAILNVLCYSFRCLLMGKHPTRRHDGTPFTSADAKRSQAAGLPLSARGCVAEVKGDWMMFKDIFRLPSWNEKKGCCFRCVVTPSEIKHTASDASWRRPERRMTHWMLVRRMQEGDAGISPLFSLPFFSSGVFKIDWLHVADLGVACDFLGNLFMMVLPKMEGASVAARVRSLYRRIRSFYERADSESRLDDLTFLMIRKSAASPPKLRAKAGEARALVPFAVELADAFLDDNNPLELSAKQAAKHLKACYDCLHGDRYDSQVMAAHSRKFCSLWVALDAATPSSVSWRVKPKMHLFQEMCEESQDRPTCTWTYRDEDFGGSLAGMSRRRGGAHTALSTSRAVLQKFMCKYSVPVVA